MSARSSLDVAFFDVHGTLIRQTHTPPQIFQSLCAEADIEISLERVQSAYPPLDDLPQQAEAFDGDEDVFWRDVNAWILERLGISDRDGSLAEHLMTGFKRPDWWAAFDDAIPTVNALQSYGYRVGTIANARHLVMARLHHTDLLERFDAITYSEEVGYKKPDARIFEVALGRMSVSAEQAVHVGDRLREDVQGAQAYGLRAILLDRDDRQSDADCERVQSLDELPALLNP